MLFKTPEYNYPVRQIENFIVCFYEGTVLFQNILVNVLAEQG